MENNYAEVLLDVFLETIWIVLCVFICYILLSFIEGRIAKKVEQKAKVSPFFGAVIGLIPQCGFSIICADLYKKKYLTMGTLIAVFIACSDEALPIFLSHPDQILSTLALILIKFIVALTFGYFIDFIFKTKTINKEQSHSHDTQLIHKGCCHHEIETIHESPFKTHLLHPLIHSLKIGLYVLIINFIFSTLIYLIGENTFKNFLNQHLYLTPFLASLIGLIPNCASSVMISELYLSQSLSFAATCSGLICNAGLGLVYLFKDKKAIKQSLLITFSLLIIANIVGYILLIFKI